MCGIVAVVGTDDAPAAIPTLLEGLQRLEYRGYDSAGLAVVDGDGLTSAKSVGRVADLRAVVDRGHPSRTGIAHTRWATHGQPSEANAHPQLDVTGRVAVVHNGIIENADSLRTQLAADGVTFSSETDTEVLAQLVGRALQAGAATLEHAVRATLESVVGTYGLVVLSPSFPDQLVVARNGSPIVIGLAENATLVASDEAALVRRTSHVSHLADGEVVTVRSDGFGPVVSSADSEHVTEPVTADPFDLGDFDSFMQKEIHEQSAALAQALRGRLDERNATARLGGVNIDLRELRAIRRVKILGCGSAYYAGQLGAVAIEEMARIPADAEPAAEFRYRNPVVERDTLYVAVSQSGETIDTLMAVQELQRKGAAVIGMVNSVGSAIARQTGQGVFIHAGPEFSVASTKAVTNMSACFVLLGLLLGRTRDLGASAGARIVRGLADLPAAIDDVVSREAEIAEIARAYADARSMYFIGRYRGFPVAREGAQKLKEITYIHAEAYQASELKHGPLALVDPAMPSVVVVPNDELLTKNLSTIEQIRARGGRVLVVTSANVPAGLADHVLRVPAVEPELEPILLNIPLQLFSLHVANTLSRDVDKPRNLAKSVTVE
ncbi:glutamine--fructose-6-phosphate transaminase (isomerizing) [uncultured Jatrophihabitans sp.]|uniref:glutamine--fructose-6-phosphate transaminase (isomerizing) n=1 Tax=uncultured Jatrophihabitans sp. TaxID=1610747 RepID=UPI0035CBAE8F